MYIEAATLETPISSDCVLFRQQAVQENLEIEEKK